MDQYVLLGCIGEGAHGVVFKAKDRKTGELVALKKIPLRRPEGGLPPQTLREIQALLHIQEHPHVVRLGAVFASGPAVVLALELLVGDLGGLLRSAPAPLPPPRVRALLAMTLRGLSHCHRHHVMHRDLKPSNLLLDARGRLKLGDLGLARVLGPPRARPYSHQVATRWYRAPELLYGARDYDEGVDIWAVGCIFGELLTLSPLFPGDTDLEQLCRVLSALGTPSPSAWPELRALPDYRKVRFARCAPAPLERLVPGAGPEARDLLRRLLRMRPARRPRAEQALLHPYFFGPMELTPPPHRGGPRSPPHFDVDAPLEPALPPPSALCPPH
ncbi:LOW QUALITY PROTEIN: cyclin-dependent kinase 20 [Melopsittacus undulatus]|uniref:LOW QUALITY PROTEIN: cyclin-dependent kinase 20 n=1 Tax=Melopsittacus undulatus TaxID=13146 RepID=UPI00146D8B08|nr:LOW QUALITY PROTEIN: cyclin-dependent kinase 20-like [Melopsittacus undulatus]